MTATQTEPEASDRASDPITALRRQARDIFAAAVSRADPARALARQLEQTPLPLKPGGRILALAVGKAAVPMMREALGRVPDVAEALVVTNTENHCALPGARVLAGSHPVPDAASAEAGRAVIDVLKRAGEGDNVLAMISGGGSALMAAPAGDIPLADYATFTRGLLASGLGIDQVNLLRQQIDRIKGGGLLRCAAPARVHGFVLSDVVGDDLRAIASGPTVAPLGQACDAVALLHETGIWDRTPASIRHHLMSATPPAGLPEATNHLVGSNRHSLDAMLQALPEGLPGRIVSDHLVGDVQDAAVEVLREMRTIRGPVALIFGGETTVQIKGTGLGGRNQELALRVALSCAREAPGRDWVFLSGGTDGRDGPTEAAGGLVDPGTLERIAAAGGDVQALLDNNDSNAALALAGDLLTTGGTGTNVADVQILILA
ncbi:DUF4147 domain-containing protein [Roseicyclus sp. F158]|uniref:DUF4147 domain-containing protein n=1 Tax=Tropicimonas omnivorans TaxID=3075590 RepID=A0ABU3DF26_9RHOB|nr:DUF4147 domain-containing protein [Roseicyclus sp. F158]MDT0682314.1 DUF4147 domain-containing protein [Roseicyclus sp. F158]